MKTSIFLGGMFLLFGLCGVVGADTIDSVVEAKDLAVAIAVPEPSMIALLVISMLGVAGLRGWWKN
jgi:predicted transporter